MTQLTVFLRKEVLGGWRNKKIIICGVIFLMVGMLSPFLAKIMPDIFSSMVNRWDPNHCFHADICRFVDAILWQYRFIGSLGFCDTLCGYDLCGN